MSQTKAQLITSISGGVGNGTAAAPALTGDDTDTGISFGTNTVTTSVGGAAATTVDSSGRLLVGTTSATSNFKYGGSGDFSTKSQIDGASSGRDVGLALVNHHSSDTQPVLRLAKSRGTAASPTAVSDNDYTGSIQFMGYDGTRYIDTARIDSIANANGASNDMPGALIFLTNTGSSTVSEHMRLYSGGELRCFGVYNSTSGLGANTVIASNGFLARSTSSIKYKTDVETLQDSYADALLECRPVWYRSLSKNDNPNHGYWGFIAEEVAEIDPRLVHWKTSEPVRQEDGSVEEVPCEPEPEGVQYDRFVPHLVNLIKRQKDQIASLEARLTALEGA